MSNVKRVLIEGRLPFNCNENEALKGWLACMNLPLFGLRITWGDVEYMMPNEFGGKTAFYDFTIKGKEAVAWDAIDELVAAINEVGGSVCTKQTRDLEG
jgi:hypothetical protein